MASGGYVSSLATLGVLGILLGPLASTHTPLELQ